MATMTKRTTSLIAGIALGIGSFAGVACSDEDGDGGTTDEEIDEVDGTVDSIQDEIQEEVDAQDKGSNEDGE